MKQKFKLVIFTLVFIPTLAFSQTNKSYISVSYSSICCGTLSEKPIMDFVKAFEKQNRLNPFEVFIETGLGKEGEYTFYFGIDNLNKKHLKSFTDGLKIIIIKQNKQRKENKDGHVSLNDKLISKQTLIDIKANPRYRYSKLKIYNYKD